MPRHFFFFCSFSLISSTPSRERSHSAERREVLVLREELRKSARTRNREESRVKLPRNARARARFSFRRDCKIHFARDPLPQRRSLRFALAADD